MREADGDLFEYPADAIVVTTNGYVKVNGWAVMGRGVAAQAQRRWPYLPELLGNELIFHGNHVWAFDIFDTEADRLIITFPVKHNWWEKADKGLIEKSLVELVEMVNRYSVTNVALPRPGCGNGQLDWKDIKPLCARYLDDRFVVVYTDRIR